MVASPVFSGMLDDSQFASTVPLDETADDISNLLEMITTKDQGRETVKFEDIHQAIRLGDVVDKYDIWRLEYPLAHLTVPFTHQDPLRAFIFSCRLRNTITAQSALKYFKNQLQYEGKSIYTSPWLMEASIVSQFEVTTFALYTKFCLANLEAGSCG